MDQVVNSEGAALIHTQPQTQCNNFTQTPQRLIKGNGEAAKVIVTDQENLKMMQQWNNVMCKEMKVPQGYQSVAVLIIKWCEELDELRSEEEVGKLDELLRGRFHYTTEIFQIDDTSKPTRQLKRAIFNFVDKHNGPNTLLIVYYTGHGSYDEVAKQYMLHASSKETRSLHKNHQTSADWTFAATPLSEDAECDVLLIMDSCFASNITKGLNKRETRVYKILCASAMDKPTDGPGPKSFTTALINSLTKLLEENPDKPFVLRQLCEKINRYPERHHRPSLIWTPDSQHDGEIEFLPLKNTLDERKKTFNHNETRALLHLRLSLTNKSLNHRQITVLCKALCEAVKEAKVPVRRIDWQSLQNSTGAEKFASIVNAAKTAQKWTHRRSQSSVTSRDGLSQSPDDLHPQTIDQLLLSDVAAKTTLALPSPPPTSRKRGSTEESLDLSDSQAKRRCEKLNKQQEQTVHDLGPITPSSSQEFDDP